MLYELKDAESLRAVAEVIVGRDDTASDHEGDVDEILAVLKQHLQPSTLLAELPPTGYLPPGRLFDAVMEEHSRLRSQSRAGDCVPPQTKQPVSIEPNYEAINVRIGEDGQPLEEEPEPPELEPTDPVGPYDIDIDLPF